MPESAHDKSMLRHVVPPRLKLAGFVALGLAAIIVAWGLVSRVVSAHDLNNWTDAQAVPTVQVVTLGGGAAQDMALPGTVQAFTDAPIYAQVSGYVKKWYVDIGTPVKQGQLLAELDTPDLDGQLQAAQANLANAVAAQKLSAATATRWDSLFTQGAVAQQDRDEKDADLAAKSAAVAAAKANVYSLQSQASFKRLVAPFSGIVTSRSVDTGALVTVGTASATPLFTVTDQTRLRIYVRVPQTYATQIRPGMTAHFTVPEHPGQDFVAAVMATDEAISAATGTSLVQLQIDNKDQALRPGEYAQVTFALPAQASAVRIPSTALLVRETGLAVATVSPDSKIVIRPITISRDLGTSVEVASGLKRGDRVIDNPSDSLAPGDPVRVAARRPAAS